ncbi:MAG: pyrroline-5-carboxylate reductase [Candidatus Bathyarchaeota archaeon]|nr:pyrroline-5-carboxylate reductase [Candidatus Bathyarchaeota archaeon]
MSDKIAVIGTGMMGGAIIKSLLKGNYLGKITAADFVTEKLKELEALGVETTTDNRKAAAKADIILVSVKPGDLEKVLKGIIKEVKGKLVVSTAATVPLWFLKKQVPDAKVVRIMPNVAALVQASYTAFCCDQDVTEEDKEKIKGILGLMGLCEELDEKYMDAITGLSGSGPGYLSIVAEALTYAGLKVGLPRNIAEKAAAQNLLGTAKLILELPESPTKIRDMVTTPGGTTIDAIYEWEASGVRQGIMNAVEKATVKSALIREKVSPEDKR